MILDVEIFLDNWIFVIHFWIMKNNLFIELDWSGISNLYLNMLKVWKISTWFLHCFSINSYKSQLFTRYSYWMATPSIEEELMNYPRLLTNWRIIPILWRLRWRCHPSFNFPPTSPIYIRFVRQKVTGGWWAAWDPKGGLRDTQMGGLSGG